MVIGNGLLANTFADFQEDDRLIIFASGISNSAEINLHSFIREKDLLLSYKDSNQLFVYFSTTGIYDPDLAYSPYILHKKELEVLIQSHFKHYLIFRLPIVVSESKNIHTLTNFIYNKIITSETVPVFKNAYRYLIGIQDVRNFVTAMIQSKRFQNEIIDLNLENAIKIEELIKIYETVLNKKSVIQYINRGSFYQTNNSKFINFINDLKFKVPPDYIQILIEKYYLNRSL